MLIQFLFLNALLLRLCGWCVQQKFTKDYEKQIKQFGMLRKYDDSQEYLLEHPHLTCEETANYLVIWCINLEVEEVRLLLCNQHIWTDTVEVKHRQHFAVKKRQAGDALASSWTCEHCPGSGELYCMEWPLNSSVSQ